MTHRSARPSNNSLSAEWKGRSTVAARLAEAGALRLPIVFVFAVMGLSLPLRSQSDPGAPTVITSGNPGAKSGAVPVPSSGTPVAMKISPNVLITDTVAAMPLQTPGSYRANVVAMAALRRAIRLGDSQLVLDPAQATPSFCSGATYIVFVSVLEQLRRQGKIPLDAETLRALLVQDHQVDGVGVWGRWNANGPGTARLFFETGLGRNFTSFEEARPGDFMKIFWNDEIGAKEAGHSVIYLESISRPEGEFVRYWSSNQPNGFSIATIPRQRIKRVLFSRLEHPEQIRNVLTMPGRDPYLASMLKKSSSGEEVGRMVGTTDVPLLRITAAPNDALATNKPPAAADRTAVSPKATVAPSVAIAPTATPAPAKETWLKRLFRGKPASE